MLRVPITDYYYTIKSPEHGDVSSGTFYLRYKSSIDLTGRDLSAEYHYYKRDNTEVSGHVGLAYPTDYDTSAAGDENKGIDLSFNLSDAVWSHVMTNDMSDDAPFEIRLNDGNGARLQTVTISKEAFYDLPTSLGLHSSGANASRFVLPPSSLSLSGDAMTQSRDLIHPRNIVLDICGSATGFPYSLTANASWVTDVSWQRDLEAPNPSVASHWTHGDTRRFDLSSNVMPGRGTSRLQLSVSGEHVFDVSYMTLKMHVKVPGATEVASIPDVSLVLNLSDHVGNLASLQKVEVLEYKQGAPSNKAYRTIYDTPDVIYVDTGVMYRDRAKQHTMTDISYFIANRDYYFCSLGSTALVTASSAVTQSDGKLMHAKWSSPTSTNLAGGSGVSKTGIPVVTDLSMGLSAAKDKETVRFVGLDASSTLTYRLLFSRLKPSMVFDTGTPSLVLSHEDKHVVSSALKKDVAVRVVDALTVDVSFVVGVPRGQTHDVSLENVFVTSKVAGLADVSAAPIPDIVYPKEYVYNIPTGFSYELVGQKWSGLVTSSGDSAATVINTLYDQTYMKSGSETHRTAFDVNQVTNYVEISLNELLPSDVSMDWFSDLSFVQYSTWTGAPGAIPDASWISVSFDKSPGGMVKGGATNAQTIAFSICGECLTSHNVYLRQHFLVHDLETNKTRDVPFDIDLSDHLMAQPVLKRFTILDHKDMMHKEPADVSYVVNVSRMRPEPNVNPTVAGVGNGNWAALKADMSCVGRFEFEADGTGAHNSLASHYVVGTSMSYKKYDVATGSIVHYEGVGPQVQIGSRGISYVDICGHLADASLSDVSFGMQLRRNDAPPSQMRDVSAARTVAALGSAQIWHMPTDVSWVHAKTTLGLLTQNKDKSSDTGFLTNVHDDTSYNTQTVSIDFSGGHFPTTETFDFIRDVSYSTQGGQANIDFHSNQHLLSNVRSALIHDSNSLARRLVFDLSRDSVSSVMYLQFRLIGPNNENYYIIKNISNYVLAKEPPKDVVIWPIKATGSNPYNHKDHSLQFAVATASTKEARNTNNIDTNKISQTQGFGVFNQLQDMSLTILHKNTDSSYNYAQPVSISFDVSYMSYSEYVSDGMYGTNESGYIPPKGLVVYNQNNDVSFSSFLSWRDLSKGVPNKMKVYVHYAEIDFDGAGSEMAKSNVEISANFSADNIVRYLPPKGSVVSDVSTNVGPLAHGAAPYTIVTSLPPGKKMTLMASGEVTVQLDTEISYNMLPSDVGEGNPVASKHPIQRVVQAIDISYAGARNAFGLLSMGANNDVSCVPGITNQLSYNKGTQFLSFHFDPSATLGALSKYQPHTAPAADLSINLTFYTDLTHSETSTVTWVVKQDEIDWLDTPTKFKVAERKTRYLSDNAKIAPGPQGDMSWSTVRDTSMTLVLDNNKVFHRYFPRRYAGDLSGQIVDLSLVWSTDTTGDGTVDSVKTIDVGSRIRSSTYDANYLTFDLSWQDFSAGLPVDGDADALKVRMRVHDRLERSGESNLLELDISTTAIETYKAPKKVSELKGLYRVGGGPVVNMTDFSLTTLYGIDTSLNMIFDASAFGHVYDPAHAAGQWQPVASDVIKEVSYSWLHSPTFHRVSDASIVLLPRSIGGPRDVLQIQVDSTDLSAGVPTFVDPSALHIEVALWRDRAKTPALVRCVSMNIATTDISYYVPPTTITVVKSRNSAKVFDPDTVPNVFTDISINIELSNNVYQDSWSGVYTDASTAFFQALTDISLTYGGVSIPSSHIDISSDLKTIITRFPASSAFPPVYYSDASINIAIYKDLAKRDKMVLSRQIDVSNAQAPLKIETIQSKFPTDVSFSAFGGINAASLGQPITFTAKTDKSFSLLTGKTISSDFIRHGSVEYNWLGGGWRSDGVRDVSININTNEMYFTLDASHVLLAGDVSNASATLDVSLQFFKTPGNPADGYTDASLGAIPANVPTRDQVRFHRYPHAIGDVSSTLLGAQFGGDKVTTLQDSSINLIISEVNQAKFLTTEYGKTWKASDFVRDVSLTVRPERGASYTIRYETPVVDISLVDASKIQIGLKEKDVSAGFIGTGTIDFSMSVYRDISKSAPPYVAFGRVAGTDISYYQPPTEIDRTKTQSGLVSSATYFTDTSMSTWYDGDISMTVVMDREVHTDASKDVIVDISYEHDWVGAPRALTSVKETAFIDPTDKKKLTFVLKGSDLSAGVPVTDGDSGSHVGKDISFHVRVYEDRAKTLEAATFTTSLKGAATNSASDISFYKAPFWNKDYRLNAFDVSCENPQIDPQYKFTMLQDCSINLTISSEVLKSSVWNNSGFGDLTYDNWIYDISLQTTLGNWRNDVFHQSGGRTTGRLLSVDGSNSRIQIGLNSNVAKDVVLLTPKIRVAMFSDRSKSASRIHTAVTKVFSSEEVSKNELPSEFASIIDKVADSPDTSFTLVQKPDPKIKVVFKLNKSVDTNFYDLCANTLEYQYKNENSWYKDGITSGAAAGNSSLTKYNNVGISFEVDIDPSVRLWNFGWGGLNKTTEDVLRFRVKIGSKSGTSFNTDISDSIVSLDSNQISYFFLNKDLNASDVSASVVPAAYKFSTVRDSSVNFTPSSEKIASGITWPTRLYYDDVSYHVRDISWTYTYTVGDGQLTVSKHYDVSAANGAPQPGSWNPKTVDVGDVSSVQFRMDWRDISKGTPDNIEFTLNVYDDLSYANNPTARSHVGITSIKRSINKTDMEYYSPPTGFDVSYQVNGAYTSDGKKLSNASDISVVLMCTGADFKRHPDYITTGNPIEVNQVVKEISYNWNGSGWKSVPIALSNTSVSSDGSNILFGLTQQDISSYPVNPAHINVVFFKDVAMTSTHVQPTAQSVAANDISSVDSILPTKVVTIRALDHNNYDTPYTDCSLSLIDKFKPSGLRHMGKCRIEFDRPIDDVSRIKYDFANNTRAITYEISAGHHIGEYELGGPSIHKSATIGSYTNAKMYDIGIKAADISASVGSKFVDFSFDTSPALMGLTDPDHVDATNNALKFRFKINRSATPSQGGITATDLSAVDFSIPFKDISYYDGSFGVVSMGFAMDAPPASTGLLAKVTKVDGIVIDASFTPYYDICMQVHVPFNPSTKNRFNFKTKGTSGTGLMDFSMVVRDVSIGYNSNWYGITGGQVMDASTIEFRVASTDQTVSTDVSIVVHYNYDVCGNDMFVSPGSKDVSYVIPRSGIESATLSTPYSSSVASVGNLGSGKKLSMREDTSLNVVIKYPFVPQNLGSTVKVNDASAHVFIYDVSYAWNTGKPGIPEVWNLLPHVNIKANTANSNSNADVSLEFRIPGPKLDDYPFAFGDFKIRMGVRTEKIMYDGSYSGADGWRSGGRYVTYKTLNVQDSDICGHPLVIRLDDTTISGDTTTGQIYGYNLDSPYADLIKIQFHADSRDLSYGIETDNNIVKDGKPLPYFTSNIHNIPDGGYDQKVDSDYLRVNNDVSMTWGSIWRSDTPVKSYVFSGRMPNKKQFPTLRSQDMFSIGNDIRVGVYSSNVPSARGPKFQFADNSNKIDSANDMSLCWMNGRLLGEPPRSWSNGVQLYCGHDGKYESNTEQFNWNMNDYFISDNWKQTSRHFDYIIGASFLHPSYLNGKPDGGRMSHVTKFHLLTSGTAYNGSVMYGLTLYEESFASTNDLSSACLEYTRFIKDYTQPTIELTKNANVDWKTTGFTVSNEMILMLDVSSSLGLNLEKMSTKPSDISNVTFFQMKMSDNKIYNLFHKDMTAADITEVSNNYGSSMNFGGSNVIDLSCTWNNYSVDLSNSSKRFLIVQEPSTAASTHWTSDLSITDFSGINIYDSGGIRTKNRSTSITVNSEATMTEATSFIIYT